MSIQPEKNIPKDKFKSCLFFDSDISFDRYENNDKESGGYDLTMRKDRIHFFFGIEGKIKLHFGPYIRNVEDQTVTFLYNPLSEHAFRLEILPGSKSVMLFITLEKFHSLFVDKNLPIFQSENFQQKIYQDHPMNQATYLSLLPLFKNAVLKNIEHTYYYGKLLEVMSLYFSGRESSDTISSCPFLNEEGVLKKIKQAKEILLTQLNDPPLISDLARTVNIPEYQLKSGFKELYGNTIYGYVLAKKMEHARHILDAENVQVASLAYDLGYANPSHFIAAYKKHFGITPKQYLLGKNN